MSGVPQIFDTRLRRQRRERAVRAFDAFSFLATTARDEIGERLAAVNRRFERAVWHGAVEPPGATQWLRSDSALGFVPNGGLAFEEERLPFGVHTLDLFASAMTLHAINDFPGALAQIRTSLKPNGLFVGAMLGGRTLQELRYALGEAEIEIDGGLSPRVAPFSDVRDAGALMQRAGFVQPVADVDAIVVRYEDPLKLFADLRGMGETNVLSERRRTTLKRRVLARAVEIYSAKFLGPDRRVPATFEIVYLTGWTI